MSVHEGDRVTLGAREGTVLSINDNSAVVDWGEGRQTEVAIAALALNKKKAKPDK